MLSSLPTGMLGPAGAMVVVMLVFSGYTVLMRGAISHGSNPLVLGLLREVLALCLLLPYAYLRERGRPAPNFWPRPADLGNFFILGLLMIWCVQLLSALALQFITAGQYSLFAPSVPVFCLLSAWSMGQETIDRSRASQLKLASVAITMVGAIIIAVTAYASSAGAAKNPMVGFVYLFVNKFAVGAYPVQQRVLLATYPIHTVVAWGYAAGALLTLMSAATCATDAAAWTVSGSGWAAIVYSAFLSSAANYLAMAWVNKRVSPLFVMALCVHFSARPYDPLRHPLPHARPSSSPPLPPCSYPLQMVLTPLLALFTLGEPLHPQDAAGGFFILVGLVVLMRAKMEESKAQHVELIEEPTNGAAASAVGGAAAVIEVGDVEATPAGEAEGGCAAPAAAAAEQAAAAAAAAAAEAARAEAAPAAAASQ